jgi:hypothetical protein
LLALRTEMWTYPDATDMNAYLNVNGRHRGSNAWVPAMILGRAPYAGLGANA